jgi:HEPN superfamily RiboL-PSP-like protein
MQNALPNFKTSLDRVRAIADDIDAHVQDALKDSAIQARHETTLCAATVILSGFLESFLREAAEEMIADICSRAVPFDQLPPKIRITHYWDGAQHIREMARQERSADPLVLAKAADAARRLASVGTAQLPYEILWEAFADTQANPGPDEISAYLKRFHIPEPLPTLATAMNTTQNTLSLSLRSFMEIRNECAHTGSAKNVPTTSDVHGYCKLLEDVGTGIVSVFQNALGTPPYAAAAPPPAAPQPAPQP